MATILVVDDEPANRLLVKTILEHAGHEVLEAADEASALEKAQAENPALAIVDLCLPGAGGTSLIQTLRSDPRTKDLKLSLYTATPADAAMRDFMEVYGIQLLIPKPCEPAELARLVESALRD